MKKELSIIISVYNEVGNLKSVVEQCINTCGIAKIDAEIILVNDGSLDGSSELINQLCVDYSGQVKAIHFSRNFGHEAAMIAGIDFAQSSAILCMDADLQHPPTLIPEMFSSLKKGSEVVLMKRNSRKDGGFNKLLSKPFYYFLRKISRTDFIEGASDFFLISERVAKILRSNYRERNRFIRGFIQSVGFKREILPYDAPARYTGKSNYGMKQLVRLSTGAIAAFSNAPLHLSLLLGLIIGLFSMGVGIYSLVMYFIDKPVSGYTTLVVLISFLSGLQFILIGILGKYIGFLFDEIKKRPLYIVEKQVNFENDTKKNND